MGTVHSKTPSKTEANSFFFRANGCNKKEILVQIVVDHLSASHLNYSWILICTFRFMMPNWYKLHRHSQILLRRTFNVWICRFSAWGSIPDFDQHAWASSLLWLGHCKIHTARVCILWESQDLSDMDFSVVKISTVWWSLSKWEPE